VTVVSIMDATAKAAVASGAEQAFILGTSVTMRGGHYAEVLEAQGLKVLARRPHAEIERMQELIDKEFYEGATPTGKSGMLELCRAAVDAPERTAVLLACTELPLAYPDNLKDQFFEADGFTFVNTGAAHVAAILDAALERA